MLTLGNLNLNSKAGADLDHVTYGLWRTKIFLNCSKSLKIANILVSMLILIQIWRTRKLFLGPPLRKEPRRSFDNNVNVM